MTWLNNLKIRTKLILSFVIVALIAGLIGYEGMSSLKAADISDTILYENNTVPLALSSKVSTMFQRMRNNGLELVVAQTSTDSENVVEHLKSRESDIVKIFSNFEKINLPEESRIAVNEAQKSYMLFQADFKKLLDLAKNKQHEEALALWKGPLEISRVKTQDALTNLDEVLTSRANTRSQENTKAANSSIRLMTILIFVGMLLAIGFGLLISRLIGNPIKGLSKIADKLAIGDINVTINSKSKDEIGDLERSFSQMIENIKIQAVAAEKIASGDLNVSIKAKSDGDVLTLSILKVVETIRVLISETVILSSAAIDGKLETRGNIEKFHGGYREIIDGVNATMDAVVNPINESSKVLEKLSQGDLTAKMVGEYKGDYSKIKNSINLLAESFNSALSDVAQAVEATASASNQISSSTEEMAAGAQEQSMQATEIASAVEEMTKTSMETTRNAGRTADSAKNSGLIAKEGGAVVKETIDGMAKIAEVVTVAAETVKELGSSSERIGEIARVIDEIADQTNLLALNAAIEAARAGEHGRGFAVVADEVRKLAERTTNATKEIAEMIKQIQQETKGAVESMDKGTLEVSRGKGLAEKAGEALTKIIGGTEEVVDVASQVAAASEEQSATSEQISKNVESISSVIQQSAAGTTQIARAAEDLNRLTNQLQHLVERFKLDNKNINDMENQFSEYAAIHNRN